jgi:urea transport system permease protein
MIAHAEITAPATPGATRSSTDSNNQAALPSRAFLPLRYVVGIFLTLFLVLTAISSAQAQSLDEALVKLGKNSFSDTIAAIDEIAASDAEHAQAILNALSDRRLLIGPDSAVYYKDASGALHDARTGAEITPPEGRLKPARVNNRLRNMIRAALGTMTLASPDPLKRRSAAATVFRSRDAEALAAVRKARDKEQIPEIATALAEAEASILLGMADASQAEKIAAIQVLEARGDQDVMGLLRPAMNDANSEVATAASDAVASIQSRLAWVARVQNIWYGLSLGSVLLLAAIGLAITFGVMGVINMAHGEMVMLGAYTTFVV